MENLLKVKFLGELVEVKALEQRVKEEALRCYCLKFSLSYDSLDLDQMTEMCYFLLTSFFYLTMGGVLIRLEELAQVPITAASAVSQRFSRNVDTLMYGRF